MGLAERTAAALVRLAKGAAAGTLAASLVAVVSLAAFQARTPEPAESVMSRGPVLTAQGVVSVYLDRDYY